MSSGIKQVFASKLTDVDTVQREQLGTIRIEGNKIYKYVEFKNITATVAGAAGDGVAYVADKYNANQVCADMTDADSAPIGAGLLLAAVTGTAGTLYYCWIQIKGPATASTAFGGTPAAGNKLIMSTTDKTLTKSTAATDCAMGYAQDVTNKQLVLDCVW